MKKNTHIRKNSKKGSVIVETAIILPLFIIGILTIAFIIKAISIQEAVFHSFADETRRIAAEASLYDTGIIYKFKVSNRIQNERKEQIENFKVENVKYRYKKIGLTDLITADIVYDAKVKFPIKFYDDINFRETIITRAFVGTRIKSEEFTYKEMEKEEEAELVWIFPRAGTKYHEENCMVIKNEPKEMKLSNSIKRKMEPCKHCNPENKINGALVYCFSHGEVYHSGNCPLVDKYVISIEKQEAIQKGYSPCLKCGG